MKNLNIRYLTMPLLLANLIPASHAAVVIDHIDDDGKTGRVIIDSDRARIDSGLLGGYLLLNLEKETIFAINHAERAIMDLRSPLMEQAQHPVAKGNSKQPRIKISKQGAGPSIAGYQTTHYRIVINGLHCFDEYLSEALLQEPGVRAFIELIGKSTGESGSSLDLPFDPEAPCEGADDLIDDEYAKLGIPLRTVTSSGLVVHEITRVDTQADLPPGTFAAPAGYSTLSREELAQRALEKIPAHAPQPNMSDEAVLKMQQQINEQMQRMKQQRSAKSAAEQPLPKQADPAQSDPAQSDSAQSDSAQSDSAQSDSAQANTEQPEPSTQDESTPMAPPSNGPIAPRIDIRPNISD